MLRLGIDGRALIGHQAGTGRYVQALCRELDIALPEATFLVYCNRPIELPKANERWHLVDDGSSVWGGLPTTVWYLCRVGALAKRDKLQVFWGGANFLPLDMPTSCATLLTVHDLVGVQYSHTLTFTHRQMYKYFFKHGVHRADRVVTNSRGTSERLDDFCSRVANAVIWPCIDRRFQIPAANDIENVKKKYALPSSYWLSVATLEPRKNLEMLIQAMRQLQDAGQALPTLVLVGQSGWKTSQTQTAIEQARDAGLHIVQTGFVSDKDLPALYAGACLFVFPSVYEGFGMPVQEALACGTPVLATDVPEIREAGRTQACYFEPTVSDLAATLAQTLSESWRHAELSADARAKRARLAWAQVPTWQSQGRELARMIRELA